MLIVLDFSIDFRLDFEPEGRSLIKSFTKATNWSAFSVRMLVKDFYPHYNLKLKISTENALEYLAFRRSFEGDRRYAPRNPN